MVRDSVLPLRGGHRHTTSQSVVQAAVVERIHADAGDRFPVDHRGNIDISNRIPGIALDRNRAIDSLVGKQPELLGFQWHGGEAKENEDRPEWCEDVCFHDCQMGSIGHADEAGGRCLPYKCAE